MSSDAIATFDKITSGAQLEPAFPVDVAACTSTGALDLLDGSDDLVPYIPTLVPMALPSLIGMENDRGDDLHLLSLLHHFPELHEASASMPMVSPTRDAYSSGRFVPRATRGRWLFGHS